MSVQIVSVLRQPRNTRAYSKLATSPTPTPLRCRPYQYIGPAFPLDIVHVETDHMEDIHKEVAGPGHLGEAGNEGPRFVTLADPVTEGFARKLRRQPIEP